MSIAKSVQPRMILKRLSGRCYLRLSRRGSCIRQLTLWPHVRSGAVLLQWSGNDKATLAALRDHAAGQALPTVFTAG